MWRETGHQVPTIEQKSAYLNALIDEEIFLEQPKGFKQGDSDLICKLKRSLYGLKQSGRNWYESLDTKEWQPPLLGTGVG